MNRVKNLSMIAYIVILGSIYGEIVYPNLFAMWLIFAFLGGILLVFKNRMISLQKFKHLIVFLDLLITIFLVFIAFITDLSLSIKQLVFLIIAAGYLIFYFKILFKYHIE